MNKKYNSKDFGSKMPLRSSLIFQSALLVFLLRFGKLCCVQGDTETLPRLSDEPKGDRSAFFALRSCHQLLQSDSGEFFSPDYLCSNPPLWCNWTIRVDPGKRIHLRLEDLTPDEVCQLKQDQIHVDEPGAQSGGHKVLQKCWQEAKFTSSSNTLYVVVLIGGWPDPPYRGFYARYQAFGPPVVYNPQKGSAHKSKESDWSPGMTDLSDFESLPEVEDADVTYDYFDQHAALTAGLSGGSHSRDGGTEKNYTHVYQFMAAPTAPTSIRGTVRSGRGAAHSHSAQPDPVVLSATPPPQQQQEFISNNSPPTSKVGNLVEDVATDEGLIAAGGAEQVAEHISRVSDQQPSSSDGTDMMEPQSEDMGNLNMKNQSESPHLPGDHLFEVAVEVNFIHDVEESWDNLARLLLLSVKTLISKQLEALQTKPSLSSKRIKRLNAGSLYILWLQIGHGPGGVQIHRAVHSAMQGLLATGVSLRVSHRNAVIMSVSTADVNECGTQLVLCDVNADCVNHFGTYSCHCRPGFQDESRLGSGGTTCMEEQAAGCSSDLSSETIGIYVLFFLLGFLILALLAVAGALYRRHHRGGFIIRCPSSVSSPDPNNNHLPPDDNYSTPNDSDLPPPPPPIRGGKEVWAPVKERCRPVDLPLLRFSSLLPPDGYIEPQESGKI